MLLGSLLAAIPAVAQTWAAERERPAARELVAVDRTGEPAWIFGSEDIAGDGAGSFGAPEQAIDLRSAYAAVQGSRLWLRVYVSAETEPEALQVITFIDADRNAASGGSSQAPEIDPELSEELARGGYEVAIALANGDELSGAWRWSDSADQFEPIDDLEPLEAVTEEGVDRDPLDLGLARKAYRQIELDLSALEVGAGCDADLAFWASDGDELIDRELGVVGPCVPQDENANGVADVAETDVMCGEDSQCPAGGVCRNMRCVPPEVVLGDGEIVQGGALTCAVSARERGASQRSSWFGAVGLGAVGLGLALLLRRRASRRRAQS